MNCVEVERADPKIVTNSPRATAGGLWPMDDAALTKPAAVNDGCAYRDAAATNQSNNTNRLAIRKQTSSNLSPGAAEPSSHTHMVIRGEDHPKPIKSRILSRG